MKHCITLLCLLLSCNILFSQNCNLEFSGKVEDFHEKLILEKAVIYIKNLNKYTTTDDKGYFKFTKLCSGKLTIEISHISCETKTVTLSLKDNTYKVFTLEHHLDKLDEVTVKGKTRKTTKTAQETLITSTTLEKYSSLSLGDALKEVSGVSSINTGNTIIKPMINGLIGSRVLIMNNSVRLQDQEWGVEHAPNVDVNAAEQVSVIKGSGALAYGGDATGGVVVVNPARIYKKDTLYGQTTIGGQSNGRGYNVSSKINKNFKSGWFANLQASTRANGDFNTPDYNLTNTGLNAKGASMRFGKDNFESGFEVYYSFLDTEIGILKGSHIGNAFDLERAIRLGIPSVVEDFSYTIDVPKQEITHHLAKANYYKRYKNFGKVKVQYDYQFNERLEFDVRRGDLKFKPAIDLTLQTHSILADVNLDANSERKINFGLVGRYQNNFADPDTGVRRLIPDYDKYDFGIYTTTEWVLNENLTLDAGIRYDFNRIDAKKFYRKFRWAERGYDQDFSDIIIEDTGSQYLTNPVFNYHNFSAGAGAKFYLNDNSHIIGNYSLTNRPPNASELFSDGLHHSNARYELGDLRFDKEISNRISASYNYSGSKIYFLTELFYNNITDYIYLKPFDFILTNRGPFPIWSYQQTNAQLFGVDVTVNYDITENFEWQNKTAFIKGYDLKTDLPLIDMPPFTTTNKVTYKNIDWYNFSASIKSDWVFRQNEFPDFSYNVENALTGETVNVDQSTPPPAYHKIDLSSQATFQLNKKTSLNVNFGINNLFDVSYRNYLNQLRFYSYELGRNYTLQLTLKY